VKYKLYLCAHGFAADGQPLLGIFFSCLLFIN